MKEILDPKTSQEASWQYNGFDCCVTHEIYETLLAELTSADVRKTYERSLRKVGPTMEMSLRGIRVDQRRLIKVKRRLRDDLACLEEHFNALCEAVVGRKVNAGSWQQVSSLLYIHLGLRGKGTRRPHLDKLAANNFYARPFITHINAIRDARKQLGFLNATPSDDGRMLYNLNVGGTESGRLSCRESVFWMGTNCQNIDTRHRSIFVADPGKILVEVDLEQADSRNVGAICYALFGKDNYLKACEQFDLHSAVARMVWGDSIDPKEVYQHGKTYRDFAKRAGHGTNYMGSPRGIAGITGIPANLVKNFQEAYFATFPEIREWHKWTRRELRQTGCITTLFGRRRFFHDRRWADGTAREAVAYQGQSMTAEETDQGFMALWQQFPWVELLIQVHDSTLFQIPSNRLDELSTLISAMKVSLPIRERAFTVPLSAKVGKSWGEMAEWTG